MGHSNIFFLVLVSLKINIGHKLLNQLNSMLLINLMLPSYCINNDLIKWL